MKRFLAVLLLSLLCISPSLSQAPAPSTHAKLVQHVFNAVTLLYAQDEAGGMRMYCTATAYRKLDKGYRFVTASHCVHGSTDAEQSETHFFITPDANGKDKVFFPAKLVKAGDRDEGDDFAIFEIITPESFEIVPLGKDPTEVGTPVVNIASPFGLGKQYFSGYVSAIKLDRPALDAGEVKWTNVMLVQIGSGPGSSGSAIVAEDQQAIIGFLVGNFNANIGAICVPVSKFAAFEAKVDAGTYKRRPRFDFLKGLFGKD